MTEFGILNLYQRRKVSQLFQLVCDFMKHLVCNYGPKQELKSWWFFGRFQNRVFVYETFVRSVWQSLHHSQCWHLERVCEKVERCVHEVLKTKTKHSSREVAVKSHIVLQLSPDASIGSDVPLLS